MKPKPRMMEVQQLTDGQLFGVWEVIHLKKFQANLVTILPTEIMTVKARDIVRLHKKYLNRCLENNCNYVSDEELRRRWYDEVQWNKFK